MLLISWVPLRVLLNGKSPCKRLIMSEVLWNIYFNDFLQLIPHAKAHADDCRVRFNKRDTLCGKHFLLRHLLTFSDVKASCAINRTLSLYRKQHF